jgi:hypothetical protein
MHEELHTGGASDREWEVAIHDRPSPQLATAIGEQVFCSRCLRQKRNGNVFGLHCYEKKAQHTHTHTTPKPPTQPEYQNRTE